MGNTVIHYSSYRFLKALYGLQNSTVALLLAILLVGHAGFWAPKAVSMIHGNWVDEAVSEVLTDRYGSRVMVHQVYFKTWSEITFQSIEVDSDQGKPLIRSAEGRLELKNMVLWKQKIFETELHLKNVQFMKDYYQSSKRLPAWGSLIHKPIGVNELSLRVVQNETSTLVGVLKCVADGVRIDGGMLLDRSGLIRDFIHVSVSPWLLLKSLGS